MSGPAWFALVVTLMSWLVFYATRPYHPGWGRHPHYRRGLRFSVSARWPEVGPSPVGYGVRLFVWEGLFEPGWRCRGLTLDLLFLADVQVSYRWRLIQVDPALNLHSDSVTQSAVEADEKGLSGLVLPTVRATFGAAREADQVLDKMASRAREVAGDPDAHLDNPDDQQGGAHYEGSDLPFAPTHTGRCGVCGDLWPCAKASSRRPS